MSKSTFQTKRLDHHGIVAGVCHQIKLAETINRIIPPDIRQKVTVGDAVVAMVINGIGLTSRPLYLVAEAMKNKPVDVLIRKGLEAEDFNDDTLGRALDALFEADLTSVFVQISHNAIKMYKIKPEDLNLDTSSISLHGDYLTKDAPSAEESPQQNNEVEANEETQQTENTSTQESSPKIIQINHGYSKDHRPDLKQLMVGLITTTKYRIPVWIEALSGNSHDSVVFAETIESYCEQFSDDDLKETLFIMDAGWYTAKNVREYQSEVSWISRVPETIKLAQKTVEGFDPSQLEKDDKGYCYQSYEVCYGDVNQRWLTVYSEKSFEREGKTLERRMKKQLKSCKTEAKKQLQKEYDCRQDAENAIEQFQSAHPACMITAEISEKGIYEQRGRPKQGEKPVKTVYLVKISIKENSEWKEKQLGKKGKFIVATNACSEETVSDAELLQKYKGQSSTVERGFRFLKDPMFFADSLFVKTPRRIMALVMIMGLCLLVYALAEREIDINLADCTETVLDQRGQPTKSLTMRRVTQIFEGIDILEIVHDGMVHQRQILNLTEQQRIILTLFNPHVQKCYTF